MQTLKIQAAEKKLKEIRKSIEKQSGMPYHRSKSKRKFKMEKSPA